MTAARVIVTWVCTHCHRGWTAVQGETRGNCLECGRLGEMRGVHLELPIR